MNNYAYRLICFGLRMQMKLPLADILPMFHHSLPLQASFSSQLSETSRDFSNMLSDILRDTTACARSGD